MHLAETRNTVSIPVRPRPVLSTSLPCFAAPQTTPSASSVLLHFQGCSFRCTTLAGVKGRAPACPAGPSTAGRW